MSTKLYSAHVSGDLLGEIKLEIYSHEDPSSFELTQEGRKGSIEGGKTRELYELRAGSSRGGAAFLLGDLLVVGANFDPISLEPIDETWVVFHLADLIEPLVACWQPIVETFEREGRIEPFPSSELEDRTRLKVANWLATAHSQEEYLAAFKRGRQMFGAYTIAARLGMLSEEKKAELSL